MPVSEKRLAANRANAARSTGPRTPEGKARSSQNARKHGFRAESFTIVGIEDSAAYAELLANAVAVYQPVNSQELHAIGRIAQAQLAIDRSARLEAGMFTSLLDQTLSPTRDNRPDLCDELNTPPNLVQNTNYFFGEAFRRMDPKLYPAFLRHQAHNERMYRRAIEEFDRLKSLRGELGSDPPDDPDQDLPNEPISELQAEQPEPLTPEQNGPVLPVPPIPCAPPVSSATSTSPFTASVRALRASVVNPRPAINPHPPL